MYLQRAMGVEKMDGGRVGLEFNDFCIVCVCE